MSDYTPTPEAVEAAAKVIAENTDEPGWSAVVIARAALTAAGPIIAAEALRGAADALDRDDMAAGRWYAAWLRDHAERIEKGAPRG